MSAATEITRAAAAAIRQSGSFALVTEGPFGTSALLPRAAVLVEGLAPTPCDDRPAPAAWRLTLRVVVRARGQAQGSAGALYDLCDAAAGALLSSAQLRGLCRALPGAAPIEVGQAQQSGPLRQPEMEASFEVRCHFENAPAAPRRRGILSLSFAGAPIALPLSLRLTRAAQGASTAGDAARFVQNVEVAHGACTAEVRVRDVAAAEALPIGACGDLSAVIASADGAAPPRALALAGAVLLSVELDYSQDLATAVLRFAAQSPLGQCEPLTSEDSP
jgi:hypothetical protein